MSVARTVIKNSIANYGKMIYRSATAIVIIGIIARYLGPTTFGKYAFVVVVVEVINVIASMGMPSIIVREVAKDKSKTPVFLTVGIILQTVLSVTTLVIIVIVFNFMASSQELLYGAYICGLAMAFDIWGKFFSAFSQAYEKMEYNTYQALLGQTIHVILVILAAAGDFGLIGIFTALLLARLASAVFGCCIVLNKFARPEATVNRTSLRFLIKEAYPVGIKRILRKINIRVATLLLAAIKTNYEVGLFHAVYKIIQSLMFITESVSDAVFPVLSKLSGSSRSSLDLAYEKSFKFVLLTGVPLAIFLSCFSKPTIILILGSKYIEASPILQIFGWVLAFMFLNMFMERMLISGNRQRLMATLTAFALVVNILLALVLIPGMSYMGAAIATLISEMVLFVLSFYFVSRYISSFALSQVIPKPIIAGLGTFCFAIAFHDLNVVAGGFLVILVYTILLLAVKTFTPDEVDVFRRVLRNQRHL
jgi:O-antigen/teichoic acid export membrane protein